MLLSNCTSVNHGPKLNLRAERRRSGCVLIARKTFFLLDWLILQALPVLAEIPLLDSIRTTLVDNIGKLFFQSRRYEKAIEAFNIALTINPDDDFANRAVRELESMRRNRIQ